MEGPLEELDWKYLRSMEKTLLNSLCHRINQEASRIVNSDLGSEHEKYRKLYRHIKDSDEIIADCFDDWRRSRIDITLLLLRKHGLITSEHVEHLSDSCKEFLRRAEK